MILETLVRHYENLAKQGSVSKLAGVRQKFHMGLILQRWNGEGNSVFKA